MDPIRPIVPQAPTPLPVAAARRIAPAGRERQQQGDPRRRRQTPQHEEATAVELDVAGIEAGVCPDPEPETPGPHIDVSA